MPWPTLGSREGMDAQGLDAVVQRDELACDLVVRVRRVGGDDGAAVGDKGLGGAGDLWQVDEVQGAGEGVQQVQRVGDVLQGLTEGWRFEASGSVGAGIGGFRLAGALRRLED